MRIKELKHVRPPSGAFDAIETVILALLRKEIYVPLMADLGDGKLIKNAYDDLIDAIARGRIQWFDGHFEGRFSGDISRELRLLGATWDARKKWWKFPTELLTPDIRMAIGQSTSTFKRMAQKIDATLAKISPEAVADKLVLSKLFDATLFRVDRRFTESVKDITVTPEITKEERLIIGQKYQADMRRYIKDWAGPEIVKLRELVQRETLKGVRYEHLAKIIKDSYGVGQSKANFLARQETNLFLSEFKQTRYARAGIDSYIWQCLNMPHQTKNGPYLAGMVRHDHWVLNGTKQKWSEPPITNEKTKARNHPGCDFNCLPGTNRTILDRSINKLFRRWFSGKTTQLITDDGVIFHSTRNHPILTERGWVAAHQINISDNLFQRHVEGFFGMEVNRKNVIASIQDIFDALAFRGQIVSCTLTGSDFHGDSTENEKVDVIDINRALILNGIMAAIQNIEEFLLERPTSTNLKLGAFAQHIMGKMISTDSIMGLLGELQTLLFCHAPHSEKVSGAAVSGFYPCIENHSPNHTARNLVFKGNRKLTHPVLVIIDGILNGSDHVVGGSVLANNFDSLSAESLAEKIGADFDFPRNLLKGHSIDFVKPSRVVDKRIVDFSGHVFNLQTQNGWFYGDNIITHNCRCIDKPYVTF
jgi:hypothetical protein